MAETMPPIMRYFEAQQRNGGALIVADPRRSPTAQWATAASGVAPGIGRGAGERAASHPDSRTADRCDVHREPHRRVRRRAAARRRLLARTGREHHRRPSSAADRGRAHARAGANGDGADGARRRTAVAWRGQRARLHQRRAGARESRAAVQRIRHADRTGKRARRTRAWSESRSTARLSPHRDPAARRACRGGLGTSDERDLPGPASRRTS